MGARQLKAWVYLASLVIHEEQISNIVFGPFS